MLSSRVSVPLPSDPTQEDFFSSSISSLFTDDTQNSHGTPGQAVIYHSPRYGEIKLGIPQHPDVDERRKLFAHYLWNSGVVAADAIECASHDQTGESNAHSGQEGGYTVWDQRYWNVRDKDVLELGAGTALPSIISAKCGARSVTITDHPSSPALTTNTIPQNVHDNLQVNTNDNATSNSTHQSPPTLTSASPPIYPSTNTATITIAGLTWGDPFFTSNTQYGKLLSPKPAQQSFDRIIIADCLWLTSQHHNIVKTIDLWLRDRPPPTTTTSSNESSPPCALVVAGFHTGRAIVSSFFEIATGEVRLDDDDNSNNNDDGSKDDDKGDGGAASLSIAQIFEVDVDLNVREWVAEREGETKQDLKRWCVCAVLVKKDRDGK